MADDISQRLNEVFKEASLSYARKLLTSVEGMEKLSQINRETIEKRAELIRRYYAEHDNRVDAERQRLYREAAQAKFDHPAPRGAMDKGHDTITRQAQERVRLAHLADLRGVTDNAERRIVTLLESAHERNETRGTATEAFLRVGDRRSGQDRRIPKQSRD